MILEGVYNLFSYCENNVINFVDYNGMSPTRASSYSKRYNRTAVVNYIRDWWHARNPKFVNCGKNYDCTNFVSQCLHAGGLPMYYHWMCVKNRNSSTFRYTRTWTTAESLFDHVLTYLSTVTVYSATKYSQVEKNISKIESGDLLFFYKYSDQKITHAAIISKIQNGIVYYGQHSGDARFKNLKTRMKDNIYKVYIVHLSTYVKWRNY